MFKILCVDDAPEITQLLKITLAAHEVYIAATVKDAEDMLARFDFSMLVLDVDLPDGSGFDVLAKLTAEEKKIPIVFLTAKDDFTSKVSAFAMGADDFIEKPFDPRELKLRVDAKLKKFEILTGKSEAFKVGSVTCQPEEQRLYVAGESPMTIDLTSYEFRIFHLLAQRPNKIFARSEILTRVWGHTVAVTERAVDVHISNLRKKLGPTNITVQSVVGSGYRLSVNTSNRKGFL